MNEVYELEDNSLLGNVEQNEFSDIYKQCIFPNVLQMLSNGTWMLIGTLGFNYLCRRANNLNVLHVLSILFGLFVLRYTILEMHLTIYFIGIVVYTYLIVILILLMQYYIPARIEVSYAIMICVSVSMILGEIYFPSEEAWFRIRGSAMIVCMKAVAFGFSVPEKNLKQHIFGFLGYVFFPGNILLGPWISYDEYIHILTAKENFNWKWLMKVIVLFTYSTTLLWSSNCLLPLISLDLYYYRWLRVFLDAFSFRLGHYFIITLSELTLFTAGHKCSNSNIKLLQVELPRSILSVVVNWNISVHKFLKQYVFHKSISAFGKFGAVLITYVYSSLLHGINVAIAVILISMGIFSYVEFRFRNFLAARLSSCICSRICPDNCKHIHKSNSFRTIFINDSFTLLTIIQLAYTGCLMQNEEIILSFGQQLKNVHYKWSNLGYMCHYLYLILYCLTLD